MHDVPTGQHGEGSMCLQVIYKEKVRITTIRQRRVTHGYVPIQVIGTPRLRMIVLGPLLQSYSMHMIGGHKILSSYQYPDSTR